MLRFLTTGGSDNGVHSSRSGYLLFEVILTIAIVSVCLTVILRSFTTSLSSARLADSYTKAAFLLDEKMWELEEKVIRKRALPAHELTSDVFPEEKEFKWALEIHKFEDIGIDEIHLNVEWKEGKRDEDISVVTYLHGRKEKEETE